MKEGCGVQRAPDPTPTTHGETAARPLDGDGAADASIDIVAGHVRGSVSRCVQVAEVGTGQSSVSSR